MQVATPESEPILILMWHICKVHELSRHTWPSICHWLLRLKAFECLNLWSILDNTLLSCCIIIDHVSQGGPKLKGGNPKRMYTIFFFLWPNECTFKTPKQLERVQESSRQKTTHAFNYKNARITSQIYRHKIDSQFAASISPTSHHNQIVLHTRWRLLGKTKQTKRISVQIN